MKVFRVFVLIVAVSVSLAGLVPAAAAADAGAKGGEPTFYVMAFTGFSVDEAEAVVAVMRDEFPGFAGLRPREETPSGLMYGYATTIAPEKLSDWVLILLNDLGHVPGRDVQVRFAKSKITVEKFATPTGPLDARVVFVPQAGQMDVAPSHASSKAFRDGLATALSERSATVLEPETAFDGPPPTDHLAAITALKRQSVSKADVAVVYRVRARMQAQGDAKGRRLAAVGYLTVWDLRRGTKSARESLAGRILSADCAKECINQALTASTRDLAAEMSLWLVGEVGK